MSGKLTFPEHYFWKKTPVDEAVSLIRSTMKGERSDIPGLFVQFFASYCSHCCSSGTKVNLSDGTSRQIEQIKAGDSVLSYSNTKKGVSPHIVKECIDQGSKECIELLFNDGRTLTCTKDHQIMTPDEKWVQADDLIVDASHVTVGTEYHLNKSMPLFSVKLIAKKNVGMKHVYDLSVPNDTDSNFDSFMAEGIVVHNCTRHIPQANALNITAGHLFHIPAVMIDGPADGKDFSSLPDLKEMVPRGFPTIWMVSNDGRKKEYEGDRSAEAMQKAFLEWHPAAKKFMIPESEIMSLAALQ